jgi:glutathione S-transferase
LTSGTERYRVIGGPGSPYSFKMRAVLRYRRIPHDWVVPPKFRDPEGELAKAGKGIIPVMQLPDGRYWADSTPMILALEQMHPGSRSVLPDDPADRFLALLLEDIADEWLVFAMFDFRWAKPVDQEFCARRQMAGWFGAMPGAEFDKVVDAFRNRQIGMLARAGDLSTNRPLWTEGYRRVLQAVEKHLEHSRFFFGSRPSIADFAHYGQLSQLAIDPTPSEIIRSEAVRTYQWQFDLDDASGIEGEWRDVNAPLGPGVVALLQLAGDTYLPFLVANAAAIAAGTKTYDLKLNGETYPNPTRSYKRRCLLWLKAALAEVKGEPRERLESILKQYGCWEPLQFQPGEDKMVPPLVPL